MQNTKSAVAFMEPGGNAMLQLTLVPPQQGTTPEAVARSMAGQQGIQFIEGGSLRINGNPAYMGRYRLQAESGIIEATAAFISYGKNTYQLTGMSAPSAYSSFAPGFDSSIRSFRELNDARILSAQPDRVRVYRAQRGETLNGILKSQPQSRIEVQEISLLNRLNPDQTLNAGVPLKMIRSGR